MKIRSKKNGAFSLMELICIVAITALLTTLFVRAQADPQARARYERISCVSNLKQVGLAFRLWSNDHNDKFPMQYAADKGGSREALYNEQPWLHFKVLSNELNSTKILVCPADSRKRAADLSTLSVTNLSYFVGVDADETLPQMLLSGDRNLTNGIAPQKGLLELTDTPPAGWTEAMHNEAGNIGLADGSAQQMNNGGLRRQIGTANAFNKIGHTRLQLPLP